MSLIPGSFRPEEIGGADAANGDGELAAAQAAARSLEQAMPADRVRPSADFSERVMAAVALEPAPRPSGILGILPLGPALGRLTTSVQQAWTTGFGGSSRPFGVRAAALAYVLVVLIGVASVTGAVAVGTAGALNFLSGDQSPVASHSIAPPSPSPSPSPDQTEPSGSPDPSESAEPSESPGIDESAEPSEAATTKPSASSGPTSSSESSDDHSSASPDSSDDHGGGSGSPTNSPRPSETPH